MNKRKSVAIFIAFIVPLAVYLATVCPTVYAGDSGEMITAAYYLGIAHPPGYPLFCLLGKVLCFLPLGTIAFRVNLEAVLFGVLAVVLLYKFLHKLFNDLGQNSVFIPLACSLLFAFSKTFWAQNLMAKGALYSMNVFFIIAIIYLIYLYKNKMSSRSVIIIAMVNGLGLANHNTIAPLSVFFLLYAVSYSGSFAKAFRNTFLYAVTALLTALLIYMYLPLRSATNPVIDWGHPASFYGFLNHILRKQYSFFAVSERTLSLFVEQSKFYFSYLFAQMTPFFLLFILPGIWGLFVFSKRLFFVLFFVFFLSGFGLLLLSNPLTTALDKYVNEVFFIPSYFVAAVTILFGINILKTKIKIKAIGIIISAVLFISPLLPLAANYFENDRSKNYFCHDYGVNILRSALPGSIVFLSGDNGAFAPAYFKFVEKARPDLQVYDDYGRVFKNIYGEDFLFMGTGVYNKRVTMVQRALINASTLPIYCLAGSNIYGMEDIPSVSEGLLYRVLSRKAPVFPHKPLLTKRGINDSSIFLDYWCLEIAAGYYIIEGDGYFMQSSFAAAKKSYKKAALLGKDSSNIQGLLGVAFGKFPPDEALALLKEPEISELKSSELLNNLGAAYFKKGLYDESIAVYEEAVKISPEDAKSFFNIGVSYGAKKDFKQALLYFQKTIIKNPAYTEAYYASANCYYFQKDYPRAFNFYIKAIGIKPDLAAGYNGAAAVRHSEGKYLEALKYYKKAISLKPDYLEAYGNLAGVYRAMGKKEEAVRVLKTALQYSPENPALLQNLRELGER
jgi:tetratricopeptide (TPR) repeat protein